MRKVGPSSFIYDRDPQPTAEERDLKAGIEIVRLNQRVYELRQELQVMTEDRDEYRDALRREGTDTIAYLAHPVSPKGHETIESNLDSARAWLKRLTESYPAIVFVAPWITECEIWDDSDEAQREAGLARCHAVIRRCDEFWMCGVRESTGMSGELEVAEESGCEITSFVGWALDL